ncbi:general stress protein [Nocardioides zeae]|uniref:General stress protein n=1 Tax=Nocardioides imazamoxiresistens TaxID=3231893 RepID=A0ABU3PW73_9ACTN|nr:general stress protein [Nocardioides zeae]MDT9593484.1 general stress protein [Nocardioides zeae]
MSSRVPPAGAGLLQLEFPQSLATYDDYAAAQRTVDHLSDREFPVENCMIVGTDLKQVERITGRLTYPKVAAAGAASGVWLGLFVGLLFSLFVERDVLPTILATVVIAVAFSVVWAVLGYAATRGRRDFSSVSTVVATRYEVLVEHKHAARARDLLAELPGALPNPFA